MSLDQLLSTMSAMMAADGSGAHAETMQEMMASAQAVAAEVEAMAATIASHEQSMAEKESALSQLQQQAQEAEAKWQAELSTSNEKLSQLDQQIASATEAYKAMMMAANPEVPAELVTGYSIDELQASMEKAKAIVEKVKQSIGVPAGAPGRGMMDTSSMSPKQKIAAGLVS